MKPLTSLVESELKPMSSGEVLHADIEKMSFVERNITYSLVQWMQDRLEKRRELLRLRLLEDVAQVGTANEKGSKEFTHTHGTIRAEKRVAKLPEDAKFKTLLAVAGIPESSVYDEVKTKVLNPSKVQALIEVGKLKESDVDALKKVSYALFVEPAEEVDLMLEEAFNAFEAQKQAVMAGKAPAPALTEGSKSKKKKG